MAPMPGPDRLNRLRHWSLLLALSLGAGGCLLGTCAIVPPVSMLLIPPSIVGTECAVWLLALGLAATALAARSPVPRQRLRRSAFGMGAAVIALSLWTLTRVPAAIDAAETEMRTAFGAGYAGIDGGPLQTAPLSILSLVVGLPDGDASTTPGIPFTEGADPLLCDIYRPVGPGPHPIVVAIHGGAWDGGSRSEGAAASRALAGSGFTVVSIDYRLAPAHRFPDQLADVRMALAWLRSHAAAFGGDPARIALLGRSAGAQLACTAAAAEGGQVKALVGFYSPVDLTIGYRDPGFPDPVDARSVFRTFLGGTPDELPALYRDASPIEQAHRIRIPTLLITGGRDHLVDISFTRLLAERIRANGASVAVIDLPWSEHAFDAIPNGIGGQIALHHLIRFLRLALGG